MDKLDQYLQDKINLFGGNLKDAKKGAFGVPENALHESVLQVLYEVYRIKSETTI